MKFFLPFLLLLPAAGASAQQKYLIAPDQEVIPLRPGESAAAAIAARDRYLASRRQGVCSDKFYFGYTTAGYPLSSNFGAQHADVIGQWFVAKASGRIDTIFWQQLSRVGALDSTVTLRVHRSLIGPGYGPGVRPGPYPPPCQNWGYWMNTNDLDQGIAAFIEDATDTTWVSTIAGSSVPSTPPLGAELWGLGGVDVRLQPNTVNFVPMDALAETLGVTVGDPFFISFSIPPCPGPASMCHDDWEINPEVRTEWGASGYRVTAADEEYPSRLWKFYEHDKGPSNCSGIVPLDSAKRGWIARGGFTSDTLDVASLNVWYLQTVASNVPPVILPPPAVTRTAFDGRTEPVGVVAFDCDPANPGNAGVDSVTLKYDVDGVPQPGIPMTSMGADYWETNFPAPPAPATVTYRFRAVDPDGLASESPSRTMTVLPRDGRWYGIDTALACDFVGISQSGTEIDTGMFYNYGSGTAGDPDDGVAGPFDLGSSFRLFGDVFRYAWIGVDGAIGLVKHPDDFVTLPAAGMTTDFLVSPGAVNGFVDRVIVAPLWNREFILGDSTGQHGRILYGDGGDSCRFIVEWDSIGWKQYGGPAGSRFRVIMDRCAGTVEFQYDRIEEGIDSSSSVGMDSPDGAVTSNRLGFPAATRPRSGTCMKFFPRNPVPGEGWNLVSVSVLPNDGDYSAAGLFPTAPVWGFDGGYVRADSLERGRGYWIRSLQTGIDGAPGIFFDSISIPVVEAWNLVGGTSGPVPAGSIEAAGGMVVSNYIGYGAGGYYDAPTLQPGNGYWVKMSGAGTLGLRPGGAAPVIVSAPAAEEIPEVITLTIGDARKRSQALYLAPGPISPGLLSGYELPPLPPGGVFDARFASGRMLEVLDQPGGDDTSGVPISIHGAVGPVTVRWEFPDNGIGDRLLTLEVVRNGLSRRQTMERAGALTIRHPEGSALRILSETDAGNPRAFSLSRNYPNPFNPFTRIDYSLRTAGRVRIEVFNIAGERIATLIDGETPAGSHTVGWNAATTPSGVYYCRMTAGSYSAVRKMLLMK